MFICCPPYVSSGFQNNNSSNLLTYFLFLQTNAMEQMRIEEEMARHRTTHNTMDKRFACDDSRVLAYDLVKSSENPQNRLSAPECNLKKVPYCNSLTDLSSGTHAMWVLASESTGIQAGTSVFLYIDLCYPYQSFCHTTCLYIDLCLSLPVFLLCLLLLLCHFISLHHLFFYAHISSFTTHC